MSSNTKKIIGVIVVVVLVLAIIWVVYESFKPEPVNIEPTNILPNENTGIDNITNDFIQNEISNTLEENEIVNEIEEDEQETNETDNEAEVNSNNNSNNGETEKVTGTAESRQEKAIELAKEFYEEEYGNSEEIYFGYEGINGDGRYIVRAGRAGIGSNRFFFVNVDTGLVEEK